MRTHLAGNQAVVGVVGRGDVTKPDPPSREQLQYTISSLWYHHTGKELKAILRVVEMHT